MLLEARPALTLETVSTTEGLERLRPEWSALWSHSERATPFQSPEWLIPWWRQIGEGELWIIALRSAGRLVGIAPFYIYTKPGSPVRELYLVGTGTTDYLDALFEPEFARAGTAAVFAHLDAQRHRWDLCDLQELRPGSPLLEAPCLAGWSEATTIHEACPVLPLPSTVEALPRCLPARMVQNLRYYRRRAERMGQVRIEAVSRENQDELFDALLDLHRTRWSTRGLSGVLADETVQRAHRESLPGLLRTGVLRMYALRLEERIVTCYYGFMDARRTRKRAYYYLSGFDPALDKLSLGTLMIGYAIEEAVREGAAEFDFLRGREPYKYLWGARDTLNYRRQFWHADEYPRVG
jgi:CelD/BcsL family acetyltransferase involved in cellulose biosynthesis